MFYYIRKYSFLSMLIVLVVLFMGLFFWNNNLESRTDNVPANERLTDECHGIAVDSSGRIYIGNATNSKIDTYDNKGKYLYSLPINTYGDFNLDIDEKDNIMIGIAREEKLLIYDKDGKLVSSKDDPNAYVRIGDKDYKEFKDKSGNIYALKEAVLFARNRVIKTSLNGDKKIIMIMSFNDYLFRFIKSYFIITAFSILLFLLYKKYFGKRKKRVINL